MKSVFGKHSCCFLVFFRHFSARRFQFASFWRHGSKGEIKLVQLSNDWQFLISGLSIKTFKNALFSGTKNLSRITKNWKELQELKFAELRVHVIAFSVLNMSRLNYREWLWFTITTLCPKIVAKTHKGCSLWGNIESDGHEIKFVRFFRTMKEIETHALAILSLFWPHMRSRESLS